MATKQSVGYVFMALEWPKDANGRTDYSAEQVWLPQVFPFRMDESDERVFIGTQAFDCHVPDNFDPTAKQIAALEREKRAALAAYQSTVAGINERLSKLQALTNEVTA